MKTKFLPIMTAAFTISMFGLTQKCFSEDYLSVKDFIVEELKKLSNDIKDYLKL